MARNPEDRISVSHSPPFLPPISGDYLERNRAAWERWAPEHVEAGRRAWQTDELRWGIWGTPESELHLLDGFTAGEDAVELGCGTAAVSAWLTRKGIRAVGVDFAPTQIRTADALQREFNVRFPLICANVEQIGFDKESFDIAVSEYGASLWCDPRTWLREAHRLLRPEGRLVFFTVGSLLMACTPPDGGPATNRLARDYFSMFRVEFEIDNAVEFHLTHGVWVRLLRTAGFEVDNLIEVQPSRGAVPRVSLVAPEWAQRWPSEEIWVARKAT